MPGLSNAEAPRRYAEALPTKSVVEKGFSLLASSAHHHAGASANEGHDGQDECNDAQYRRAVIAFKSLWAWRAC